MTHIASRRKAETQKNPTLLSGFLENNPTESQPKGRGFFDWVSISRLPTDIKGYQGLSRNIKALQGDRHQG
jgi:hypothetical protein